MEEARTVFGLALDGTASNAEEDAAHRLCGHFGFKHIALTMRRGDSAGATNWGAMHFSGG